MIIVYWFEYRKYINYFSNCRKISIILRLKFFSLMFRKFKQFIADNQLFDFEDRILLAVSGGPDSVVLTDLAKKSRLNFAISHVNFHLRGEDSNRDEQFVRQLAEKYDVPIFVKSVNTFEYVYTNNISIEMAARDLRYTEFDRLMDTEGFKYTAVAHQQDDAIETFFLNLTRGAGIRGLTGIKLKNNRIVRPLLCFSRKEIMNYIEANNLEYRIDKSNLESEFSRNKIRNKIIPLFEEINPSFKLNVSRSLNYLSQAKDIYETDINKIKSQAVKHFENHTEVDLQVIKNYVQPECLVFEIVNEFGFNSAQAHEIFTHLDSESGKVFMSENFRLVKDRDVLIIKPLDVKTEFREYQITMSDINKGSFDTKKHHFEFSIIKKSEFNPVRDNKSVYYDLEKLKFPLVVNNWQYGDTFVPFGENYTKKLSDFFVDKKLNINQKEEVELMRCAGNIIWVIGLRPSNYYRVGEETQKILKIRIN